MALAAVLASLFSSGLLVQSGHRALRSSTTARRKEGPTEAADINLTT